ncbi:MAG: DNA-binding protein [Candidatus Thiodiazotropha sp.]
MSQPSLSTAEQVAQAAHQMLRAGQGQAISQRAILEAIGNRGSMTTIHQALTQWWQDLGDHLEQLEYLQGFPPEALSPLLEAFAVIRAQAEAQARAEYETATQSAREEVAAAQAERIAAQEALAQAREQIQILQHEIDQRVGERDKLTAQLRSETDRRQAIEQQIPAIREDARARIEAAVQRSEALQAELAQEVARHQATETRLTQLYDQERQARLKSEHQAETERQVLNRKLSKRNEAYLQAKQAGAELAAQIPPLTERIDLLTSESEQRREAQDRLQAELTQARESLTQLHTERTLTQTQNQEWRERCDKLEQQLAQKATELLTLSNRLVDTQTRS